MPRTNSGRMNPWVLVAIAVGLIVAAFFFYTGHPVRDSNLYSPHVPGWIAVVMFVLIGVLVRLADQWRPRKREKRDQDDASRKT
jgi:protein-S-isoprenylcysteine O-methyltransferase Ste14